MRIIAVFFSFLTLSTSVHAEPPKVVTDIAPVHGLVSMVMEGVGPADVILQPGASAHDLSLKPSQAGQVSAADLIVWVGPSLTPQLDTTFAKLAPDAEVLALDQLKSTMSLPMRELEDFGEDHDGHDDHNHDHDHDHDHADEGGIDPHLWLDPDNAIVWLAEIAGALSTLDPENEATYRANAQSASTVISELRDEIAAQMTSGAEKEFLVSHDAFQYFEARFERAAIGAVSLSDATSPSPKHLAELRERIGQSNVACVLVEPLTNIGLVDAVAGQTSFKAVEVDPMGADIALGASYYPTLLERMGEAFISCTAPYTRG